MRTTSWRGGLVWAALAVMLGGVGPVAAQSEADKARAIAERFATGKGKEALPAGARRVVPAPKPEAGEEQRLSEEVDMLARARAEAEARREEWVKAREAADRAEQEAARAGAAAKDAEVQRTAEERRRAEEALQAAETKRKAEEARQAAEAQRQADEERRVAEARRQAETSRQAAEAQRKADEERRVAEARRQAETSRQAAEAQRKADEERRVAEERRQAETARQAVEAQRKAVEEHRSAAAQDKAEEARQASMEAEREADAERIAEALRKAREARMPRALPDGRTTTAASREYIDERAEPRDQDVRGSGERDSERSGVGASSLTDASSGGRAPEASRRDTRVAVLMLLTPGNYGIRRNNKTADPLLCGEQGCYVSAGAGLPSDLLRHRRALGVRRTLGPRAGACRNSLGCIFRDVDLVAYPAVVQPVDMHVIRHDRRQPHVLHETSDCSLRGERLTCSAIRGPDYVLWVVPEEMAERAGPAALERALEDGLAEPEPSGFRPGRH